MIHVINWFDVSGQLDCRLVGLSRSAFGRPLKADIVVDRNWVKRASLRDFARRHARWGIGGPMLMPETTSGLLTSNLI